MIQLEHVSRIFPTDGEPFYAVQDVSFEIPEGQLWVLIGPSGSGKTTTMRMINRLETPSEGRIIINGQDIQTMDPVELRRGIGYVIQQGGIFPHLTVADNVSIVPRMIGWPKERRQKRAYELLELVGLPPDQYADRYPSQLSGGQRQRIGVARALAADPPIVLMDEPFGAVDPITRLTLQKELQQIQAEVHKTIVFVTHDIQEAFALADRIVLMRAGRVEQIGSPADLVCRPGGEFVTEFIGEDRGLRMLEYIQLEEIASPPQEAAAEAISLSGNISVLEAVREIGAHGPRKGRGIIVTNEQGEPSGYISYQDLVLQLGTRIANEEEEPEPEATGEEIEREVSGQ